MIRVFAVNSLKALAAPMTVGVLMAGSLALAQPAAAQNAQATTVLVMDEARVIGQSAVGKSVMQQLKTMGEQMNTELERESKAIAAEKDRISSQRDQLTQVQLQQRVEALGRRAQNFEQLMKTRGQELEATRAKAMETINKYLEPILKEVTTRRGAEILVDRSQLIYANSSVDITPEVIQKLDATLKPFRVERVSR